MLSGTTLYNNHCLLADSGTIYYIFMEAIWIQKLYVLIVTGSLTPYQPLRQRGLRRVYVFNLLNVEW